MLEKLLLNLFARNCSPLGDRLCCLPRRFPPTYGKYASSRSSSAPRLSSKGLAVTGGPLGDLGLCCTIDRP